MVTLILQFLLPCKCSCGPKPCAPHAGQSYALLHQKSLAGKRPTPVSKVEVLPAQKERGNPADFQKGYTCEDMGTAIECDEPVLIFPESKRVEVGG